MTITALKRQVKRAGRVSVFVDGKFAFGLSDGALLDSGIIVGQELSGEKLKELRQFADDDKLYGKALNYVALRPRSRWEVEVYLSRNHCSPALKEELLNKLSNAGLLNDVAFARMWIANRRLLKPTSRRTISLELRAKRVSDAAIAEALAEDASDVDDVALRQLIAKKRRSNPDEQKLLAYLARRGFSYEAIKSALAAEAEES